MQSKYEKLIHIFMPLITGTESTTPTAKRTASYVTWLSGTVG